MTDTLRDLSRDKLAVSLGVMRDELPPGSVRTSVVRREPRPVEYRAPGPEAQEPLTWRDLASAFLLGVIVLALIALVATAAPGG